MKAILGGVLACALSLVPWAEPAFAADYSESAKVLHQFSRSDRQGINPQGTLLRGTDGAFYGTTVHGGAHAHGVSTGHGTVFRFQADGSGFAVLHNFREAWNPDSGVAEGKDGLLYGTTESGGNNLLGTVFKLGKDGMGITYLHHFSGAAYEGRRPYAGITLDADGVCYGTTTEGGQHFQGTVFRINSNGSGYRVLYSFVGKQRIDGSTPRGTLLLASDGDLYGTTSSGGKYDQGTLFAIRRDGAKYRLIHTFEGHITDGATPFAGLIEGSDGRLYGTTVAGGGTSQGMMFSVAKDGTGYKFLRSFSGLKDDGRNVYGPLVEGPDALLYGAALNGGPDGSGLIFRIAKDGRDYAPVFFFSVKGPEGRWPYGGVVLGADGAIYGATTAGTETGQGAIFKLNKVSR